MENNIELEKNSNVVFFEDFNDGIWTKCEKNPVIIKDQFWCEGGAMCEPNLVFKNSLFHLWFAQYGSAQYGSEGVALGYATSEDGVNWTKHKNNPVLKQGKGVQTVGRPHVFEYGGKFYAYSITDEHQTENSSKMFRHISVDGIHWGEGEVVMTSDRNRNSEGFSNMSVIFDDKEDLWKMIYTLDTKHSPVVDFNYAWSKDGIRWENYENNPVLPGLPPFYGGDPYLIKIRDKFFMWHSHGYEGELLIDCRWSEDMIQWHALHHNPDISTTEPWERGGDPLDEQRNYVSRFFGHITDVTICEGVNKVLMMYQGAQSPFGIAVFNGTLEELADRMLNFPPLSRWKGHPMLYGMVDGNMLKIVNGQSDLHPVITEITNAGDHYMVEARICCYAGATHRISLFFRYVDNSKCARIWLHDSNHTYIQEISNNTLSEPVNLGPNPACNDGWHIWQVEVNGRSIKLSIDGIYVGGRNITESLYKDSLATGHNYIGFGARDTYAAIDWVKVMKL